MVLLLPVDIDQFNLLFPHVLLEMRKQRILHGSVNIYPQLILSERALSIQEYFWLVNVSVSDQLSLGRKKQCVNRKTVRNHCICI